ncbi:eukaryotic translation initiation factor 3 subunit A, partial [Clydaea vesicula]
NFKGENTLKRCEELVSLKQNAQALTLLHDFIMSKRFRSTPIASLEPILLKFIELTVDQRKGKAAKEALHQYKNISQNVAINTIETVIRKFIELAETKVTEAQSKADQLTLTTVEDLEATETPESIILSTVLLTAESANKERTDRELVTPWLKFLWEAYRTALDILRNNARLEILYQVRCLEKQDLKFKIFFFKKN